MYKFVAILNKRVETWKVMNALAHATVWLTSLLDKDILSVIDYADKDWSSHIASKYPFIILKADNSNKIRTLRNILIEKNIPFASFTQSMTIGGWEEQQKRSSETPEIELEYYGIVFFGSEDSLWDITKKYSLWQ